MTQEDTTLSNYPWVAKKANRKRRKFNERNFIFIIYFYGWYIYILLIFVWFFISEKQTNFNEGGLGKLNIN